MKFLLMVIGILFVSSASVHSTTPNEPNLLTYRIQNLDNSMIKEISERFEITLKTKDGYEVLVPVDQVEEFLNIAPHAKLQKKGRSPSLGHLTNWAQNTFKTKNLREYQTYSQVFEKLKLLSESHPELVQFIEYGESANGKTLFAVKISDNVTYDEDEPELMITAATHGDEIITTEIAMGLIDKLIQGYGSDQRITNMIDGRELFFVPIVNVDGFIRRARYDEGRDPNRSYPYPENPSAQPTASIQALIDFFESRNFVGSLDMHAYGELTMYPWAYTDKPVEKKDKQIFHSLTKKMSEKNGYTFGPISEVIYVAKGSSADYYYWQKKTIAIAIEAGSDKAPYPHEIQNYIEDQTESTWRFIEHF